MAEAAVAVLQPSPRTAPAATLPPLSDGQAPASPPQPSAGAASSPALNRLQRHTASSRLHAAVDPESESAAAIRALLRSDDSGGDGGGSTRLPLLGTGAGDYVRRNVETMRELVAKKRQIFLAQMSLDTKHSEIAKLEQRARQREEALVASEQALEQDSQRFEEYLKENDAKLQEALRRADAEARARADKAAEAKRLAASIAGIRAEMAKIEEQLQECRRFKAFLDGVTPEEWFASLAAEREAKKAAMRDGWRAACDALAARKAEAAAAKARAEHDMQWARTQQQFERAERAAREAAAALREALAAQDPPEPDYSLVDAEEAPMYFRDPAALLAVFSQLEASNMLQIQTAQDAEAALEAARAAHAAAAARLDGEAGALQRQVAELEGVVGAARQRCAALRAAAQQDLEGSAALPPSRFSASGAGAGDGAAAAPGRGEGAAAAGASPGGSQLQAAAGPAGAGISLAALTERLAAAYEAAGFAPDASVTPLQMLQKVEAALEECLAAVGPPGGPGAAAAEAVERAREKERRQAAREHKLTVQKVEHEARVARVLQRAAAPKFQKTGKPAMTRSVVVRAGGDGSEGQREDDGEAELAAFLALVDETFHCGGD